MLLNRIRRLAPLTANLFLLCMLLGYLWVIPRLSRAALAGYADFSNFYTAGLIVRRGEGAHLYNPARQLEVQSQFSAAARQRGAALLFLRPPFQAVFFAPLTWLPYQAAYALFVGLNLICVVASGFLMRRELADLAAIPATTYFLALITCWPIAAGLLQGQDAGVLLLLFTWAFVAYRRGWQGWAGVALGLALVKFHLVLPILFVLLLRRRWRSLLAAGSVAAGLLITGALAVGVQGYLSYPAFLANANRIGSAVAISPGAMPNLRGFLQAPFPGSPPIWADLLLALFSLALLLWVARRWTGWDEPASLRFAAGYGLTLTVASLVAFYTYSYDFSSLLPWFLLATRLGWVHSSASPVTRGWLIFPALVLQFTPLYAVLAVRWHALCWFAVPMLLLALGWSRMIRSWPNPANSSVSEGP